MVKIGYKPVWDEWAERRASKDMESPTVKWKEFPLDERMAELDASRQDLESSC